MTTPNDAAEDAGFRAHNDGRALSGNPYENSSILRYQAWRRGWQRAEKAADDANIEVQFREPR